MFIQRNGANSGNLSIYTRTIQSSLSLKWTRSGNKGNVWLKDFFNIKVLSEFEVIFEGFSRIEYFQKI
jgi:hypothetical protein